MTANPLPPFSGMGVPTAVQSSSSGGSSKFRSVDPLRFLRQHWLSLFIALIVGIVLGGGTWYLLDKFAPKYESTAILHVTGGVKDAHAEVNDAGTGMQGLGNYIQNQMLIMYHPTVLDEVLTRGGVRNSEWGQQFMVDGQLDLEEARKQFKQQLVVAQPRGSTLIRISFQDDKREGIQEILNNFVEVYMQDVFEQESDVSINVKRTFQNLSAEAEMEVRQLQGDKQRFIEQNDLYTLNEDKQSALIEYESLTRRSMSYQYAIPMAQEQLNNLMREARETQITPSNEELMIAKRQQPVASREEQLRRLDEFEGILKRDGVGPKHASRKQIELQRYELEREIEEEMDEFIREMREQKVTRVQKNLQMLLKGEQELLPKIEQAAARLTDVTVKLENFKQLEERLELAVENYNRAEELLHDIRVREQRLDARRIRVSQQPTNANLVFPKPLVVVPGVAILTALGFGGLMFLREMLDQRVKSPSDVKLLSNVDMLGMLPDAEEDLIEEEELPCIVRDQPGGLMAENFRQIRTSVLARMDRRGYKTVMFCGAQAESGVSMIVSNLAVSLAHNGRKVLVLDANLRRPMQGHICGMADNREGLVDVLRGESTIDDAIVETPETRVHILTAGACHSAHPELLEGHAFRDLLATLESRYDIILLDAPPVLLASDSLLLAKQVDAAVVVVRASREKTGMVERMIRRIDGHRADLLGVVLNGVKSSAGGYFRRNYREFYEYSDGNGTTNGNGAAPAPKRQLPTSDRGLDARAEELSSLGDGSDGRQD